MYQDRWIKFSWDLTQLPDFTPQLRSTMRLHRVEDPDVKALWHTVKHAYEMDSGWSVGLNRYLAQLEQELRNASKDTKSIFLLLEDGKCIIGVSLLHPGAPSGIHFITGVCVQNEYRCRGYGTALLHASLHALAQGGLSEACAITRDRTTAARFLYPKFSSRQESFYESARPTLSDAKL